ncbi:hypothetical protein PMAYCL1PPCAC_04475, partial [Pristionchus mayeri]
LEGRKENLPTSKSADKLKGKSNSLAKLPHGRNIPDVQMVPSPSTTKKRGRPPLLKLSSATPGNQNVSASLGVPNGKRDSNLHSPHLLKKARRSSKERNPEGSKATPNASEAIPLVYNMMLPKKIFVDKKIDVEVDSRRNETPEEAYKQVLEDLERDSENGVNNTEWKIDYPVAFTKDGKKVVVKYEGYATPSIIRLKKGFVPTTLEFIEYWKRAEILSVVAKYLKRKMGQSLFDEKYPNRFVPDEEGATESAFVTNPITKYKNWLRSFEWRQSSQAEMVNQPHFYFEDWTDDVSAPLPLFKYTNVLLPSRRVKHALAKSNEFSHMRCKLDVCEEDEGESCDSALLNRRGRGHRKCACKIVKKVTKDEKIVDKCPVECTNECECDPEQCGNRVIQRGRQIALLIFKDWRKSWTCLVVTNIKKGDFVGEYTGEVMTTNESERRDNHAYYMEMPNVREIDDPDQKMGRKTHKKLIIDGFRYGNETRFISHSCEPNLELVNAYVERAGGWFCRMVFIAKQDIEIGEELTFDYFPKIKFDEERGHFNPFFDKCECGSKRCKFIGPLTDEDKKTKDEGLNGALFRKMKEEAEEEEDSWSEGSEDESEEKKKEIKRKKLLARGERCSKRSAQKENFHQQMFDEELAKAIQESAEG